MTKTPDAVSPDIDEDSISELENERQEKEDKRDAVAMNGNQYRELSAQITKLTTEIDRQRALRPV